MTDSASKFIDFVDKCPLPFQFCEHASNILRNSGFTELSEDLQWSEIPKKGFFTKEGKGLIAFNNGGFSSGIIVGTHCDSPCLHVKTFDTNIGKPSSPSLHVSLYGGGLWDTWFNRDLRLAGRIGVKDGNGTKYTNIDSEEAIGFIPLSNYKKEENLIPIIGADKNVNLFDYIEKRFGVKKETIVNHELGFVDACKPSLVGTKGEFIASMRIDNLGSTYSAMEAFLQSEPRNTFNVLVVFDYEEEGSESIAGADSDFLESFLEKIIPEEEYHTFIANSLVVSSDNAHAWHPNFMDKHEENHRPILGGGPVLKRSPESAYASDTITSYPIIKAAELINIPLQKIINRNDVKGGSTIGPIVSSRLGIPTVDIGQPQLAMHSIRELMAVADIDYHTRLLAYVYQNYEDLRVRC